LRRLASRAASFVGFGVIGTVALAAGILLVRWAWVAWLYEPTPPVRAAQKDAYLASLPRVDPAAVPNVVVILFDDLGYGDLSVQGNRLIETPRIDAIAAEGLRMTHFYAASPVCTPSRAALLTGRYPVRSRTHQHVFFAEESFGATVRKLLGAANELPRDEILVPEALAAAGYATGMVGKWHLGGVPGHQPNDFGFREYYGVLWSNDMQPLHVYRDREIEVRDETEFSRFGFFEEDGDRQPRGIDPRTFTRRYTEEAIGFLERHRDEPFFLYLSHTSPHVPHFPDPEHAGKSAGGRYGDVVEDLDRSTGAVLDALERLGLSERTLVVVTSDNGGDWEGNNGGLRGHKQDTFEGGMRVPMLVRWPGRIAPNTVSDAMAMNFDLFPTLLALAGLPLPEDRVIDGADLAPVWLGGAPSPHDQLFYFPTIGATPDAVRDARFKYRRETGQEFRSRPHLSDLSLDAEAHNLREKQPEVTARLQRALDAMTDDVARNPRGWR
jgi:arylsulfatase A-like enzyme